MRIIVYPHAMELGGSQLNAIQLAGAMANRGHDVMVVSEPGPLVDRVHELGLPHVGLPAHRRRPSPQVALQLIRLVRDFRADVVHGYEWPPAVEAYFGPGLLRGTAVVGTIMSMSVVGFLPRGLPLLVGTEDIRAGALAAGYRSVTLLEPPVDTDADRPGLDDSGFRARYDLDPAVPLAVIVSRLVPELKRESLLASCTAVGQLAAQGVSVQLAVVGDGPIRGEVAAAAAAANAAAGRRVVTLTGALTDPRPAYAAADVLLGMGGSALRGLAFGTPLVVLGERGFSELLTPDSAPTFLRQGWYGQGPGSLGKGVSALAEALRLLVTDPARRAELGAFGRTLVITRFSLVIAAGLQERVYDRVLALDRPTRTNLTDTVRSGVGLGSYKVRRKVAAWRGTAPTDDANAVATAR